MQRTLVVYFCVLAVLGAGVAALADGMRRGPRRPPAAPIPPAALEAPEVPELLGAQPQDYADLTALRARFLIEPLAPIAWDPLLETEAAPPWLLVEDEERERELWARTLALGVYGRPWGAGGSGYTY